MERLIKLREEHHLTQMGVQMGTGIEQSLISKYETGTRIPSIDNYIVLAKFFNTSVDYLLGLTNEKEPYERVK